MTELFELLYKLGIPEITQSRQRELGQHERMYRISNSKPDSHQVQRND